MEAASSEQRSNGAGAEEDLPAPEVVKLDGLPSLSTLYGKAAFGAIPGSGLLAKLPLIGIGGGRGGAANGNALPNRRVAVDGAKVDLDGLARYCRVCGFTMRETLPVTYPHMLAFPLQMKLMLSDDFPFPLLGVVHMDNEITQRRPIEVGETLDLSAGAVDLRPHPKGQLFTLLAEARVGEELVWEERGTILRRGGGNPAAEVDAGPTRPSDDAPPTTEWRLGGDLGRRYGSVSGDRNPIHMHQLTAKAFGFPRAIAHGMWSKARCLAQLEGRAPDSFTTRVSFRKPVLLPSRVAFVPEQRDDGSIAFAMRSTRQGKDGKPTTHLVGEIR